MEPTDRAGFQAMAQDLNQLTNMRREQTADYTLWIKNPSPDLAAKIEIDPAFGIPGKNQMLDEVGHEVANITIAAVDLDYIHPIGMINGEEVLPIWVIELLKAAVEAGHYRVELLVGRTEYKLYRKYKGDLIDRKVESRPVGPDTTEVEYEEYTVDLGADVGRALPERLPKAPAWESIGAFLFGGTTPNKGRCMYRVDYFRNAETNARIKPGSTDYDVLIATLEDWVKQTRVD